MNLYRSFLKRLLDLVLATLAIILLSPIFIIVAVLLYFKMGGSPFFFQPRPGKNEKVFRIVKFKSMNDNKDASGKLLPANQRLTATGKFIRKHSLDEIPQLLNVIKGDMSLIGPRPLLVHYLPLYNKTQKHRHDIRPGISGWAQVNGRNSISWEEKFEFDIWYVNSYSFFLDIKIIALTVYKVLKNDGIYSIEDDIVEDFKGTPNA